MIHGPQEVFSDQLHSDKYRGPNESFFERMQGISSALGDNTSHYRAFREIIVNQRFLPAGRIQSSVGSLRETTPYNCYVSGTIADDALDIMQKATEAFQTLKMGGGIGYDFSTLRPYGSMVKSQQTKASGPVSFMGVYDAVCNTITSAGDRHGAQMGVLRVDHPDIEGFIRAKQNENMLARFNISVAVTDEFMKSVIDDAYFSLIFGEEEYRKIKAQPLWESIMRSTWDWAEPGVLFIDTINRLNNLYYCEKIVATNPCGEQPLPPYGACLLGSFNLVKYIYDGKFNWKEFIDDIPIVVRAMDNVIDVAQYPLSQQKEEALSKRRMGLGVTGLANAVEAMGHPYGSEGFLRVQAKILKTLRDESYLASSSLASEKGSFPMYDRDAYLSGEWISKLPDTVRDTISKHGMRNSHLLSIAPTGTISLCADNVSSGIEPVFSYSQNRIVRTAAGMQQVELEDYGVKYLGVVGKQASDVTPKEHLDVLATASKYVDSAVSKTCNVPEDTPWQEFKNIYIEAWKRNCKGCTTFTTGGKRKGILTAIDEDAQETTAMCYIDSSTGRHECE